MSSAFTPHFEILPPAQRSLWPALAPAAQFGFVLYGGTAIALRLGHRASIDFDFFSSQHLDRDAIRSTLPFTATATVLQDERNTWTLLVDNNNRDSATVKVSFFGLPGLGRVMRPEATDDGVLQVASLDDLMAAKLKVILHRAEAKDYRDIAAMLDAGIDLAKGLATARLTYGPNFQPSESLKALVYYEDGDLHTLGKHERERLVDAAIAVRELPDVSLLP
jgi:hypothetical protein